MVNLLAGKNLSGAQKAVLFGSAAAGNAAFSASRGQGSFWSPTAGEARSAAQLQADTQGAMTKVMGFWGAFGRALMHPSGPGALSLMNQDEAKAQQEAGQRISDDARKRRILEGVSAMNDLANPAERYQSRAAAINNMQFPGDAERWRGFAMNRAAQERLAAERPYLGVREGFAREYENLNGANFSDERQRRRAQIEVEDRRAAALAPVRSRYENLEAENMSGLSKWYAAGREGGRFQSLEQTDIARRMGLQVQDYADSMTHAGGLAGAADMSSVGGYSQLVAAQEQMRQSSDSRAMAEMLLQQLPHAIAQAIRANFGFQFRRPMGPMN
jgi:hypothetical protein